MDKYCSYPKQIFQKLYRFFFVNFRLFLIIFKKTTMKIENLSNKILIRYNLLSECNTIQNHPYIFST